MNALTVFENETFGSIRTLDEDGKVLFCAKDVAAALGYKNTRDAINRHCKGVVKRDGVSRTTNQHGVTTEQTVEMAFIPEGDVYRLAAKSELPGAEKFESWIFDEVLPTIRKTGAYQIKQVKAEPDLAAMKQAELDRAKFLVEIADRYEGNYHDVMMAYAVKEITGTFALPLPKCESGRTWSATEIGAALGVSAQKIGRIANENGIKSDKYGEWYHDKARYTDKEVSTFRYNQAGFDFIKNILENA